MSSAATLARWAAVCTRKSVPLGKYWRSSPFVFSFVPRCHGLARSQGRAVFAVVTVRYGRRECLDADLWSLNRSCHR